MAIDLDKLSRDELVKLISDAEKALKTLEARRKAEAKRAAEKAAQEYGFSLDDVVSGGSAKGGKGPKGAPKYAHPENPSQTWTGRGRQPNWVKTALESGKTLEDLKI
ncbi:H-NS family nucleoid-associated regulatory protein [Citreimonas salinaria]|uniref:DNA-binding protein H-NS n=1 Tax=Citreimonas salinaria TaxID=321339 RepID=A0A1H3JIW5_9RHOB|nr:H-NS histone family protein [Citreimonas salinaria]SDY39903.1 DNA-binding protein H-NS [Citreimonas salinaria]